MSHHEPDHTQQGQEGSHDNCHEFLQCGSPEDPGCLEAATPTASRPSAPKSGHTLSPQIRP